MSLNETELNKLFAAAQHGAIQGNVTYLKFPVDMKKFKNVRPQTAAVLKAYLSIVSPEAGNHIVLGRHEREHNFELTFKEAVPQDDGSLMFPPKRQIRLEFHSFTRDSQPYCAMSVSETRPTSRGSDTSHVYQALSDAESALFLNKVFANHLKDRPEIKSILGL